MAPTPKEAELTVGGGAGIQGSRFNISISGG